MIKLLPLDVIRTEYTGRQFGLIPFFIPQIAGAHRQTMEYNKPEYSEKLLALLLLHDIKVLSVSWHPGPIQIVWEVQHEFGYFENDVEFLPYWENKRQGIVETSDANVKVSIYNRKDKGKSLVVISNLGEKDIAGIVKINLAHLGFRSGVSAIDAATKENLSLQNGVLEIPLKGENFRQVILSGEKK